MIEWEEPERPEISALVQVMHDGLCRCGEKCNGYYQDYTWFIQAVAKRWGTTRPMEFYLQELSNGPD